MNISRLPTPEAEGVCYSEDETMKRRLIRKRQLEESEVYNAPETMAVKRRAVKEAAKTTPAPKKITNLVFDDHIEPSEAADASELQREQKEAAPLHASEKGSNAADGSAGSKEGRKKWREGHNDMEVEVVESVEVEVDVEAKPQHTLPKVLLDPRKWAQKSNQGARRSRRRLRRLLKEEQTLLSSQLQVV